MVTLTPISELKRFKAPKRRVKSLTWLLIESILFSNLITSTLATKSPEFMFSELKDFRAERRHTHDRGPKLNIRLSCGNRIGIQVGSLQKDL